MGREAYDAAHKGASHLNSPAGPGRPQPGHFHRTAERPQVYARLHFGAGIRQLNDQEEVESP